MRRWVVLAAIVMMTVAGSCGNGSTGSSSDSHPTSSTSAPSEKSFTAVAQSIRMYIAGTVNLLAVASQTRAPSAFARLQSECRTDHQLVEQLVHTPVPSGAPPSATAARQQAIAALNAAVTTCLGDLANEPRSVLPQIVRDLAAGSTSLIQAEQASGAAKG
jgi:hypothetical protein